MAANTSHATKSFAFCLEHPNAPIVERYADGDCRCDDCGLVVGERIVDMTTEYRMFGNSDKGNGVDPSRVGAAQDANDTTMAALKLSVIPGLAADDPLSRLASRNQMTSAERGRAAANREISRLASALSLTDKFQETAREMYRVVREKNVVKARKFDAVCAAVIFLACRQLNRPISIKVLCDATTVPKKTIGRVIKLIAPSFDMGGPTSAASLVGDILGRADAPVSLQSPAEHVARAAEQAAIVAGRSPISIAAAAVYLVLVTAGSNITIANIVDASGVSEATINLVHRVLLEHKDALLPPAFVAHCAARRGVKVEPKAEPQ